MRLRLLSRLRKSLLFAVAGSACAAAITLVVAAVETQRIAAAVEREQPAPGKFLELDGNRLHYVERGTGPPIFFIHGLSGSLFQFTGPLFGASDRILSAQEETAGLRDSVVQLDLRVLPGIGHMVQYAEPAQTAGFIRATARKAFAREGEAVSGQ